MGAGVGGGGWREAGLMKGRIDPLILSTTWTEIDEGSSPDRLAGSVVAVAGEQKETMAAPMEVGRATLVTCMRDRLTEGSIFPAPVATAGEGAADARSSKNLLLACLSARRAILLATST